MKILVVLQNAWQYNAQPGQTQWIPGVDPEVSRRFWRKALWACPTGKKLKLMVPFDDHDVMVGEASPFVGSGSRSVFPMDPDHVRSQVEDFEPDLVVLMGAQAKKAQTYVEVLGVPTFLTPHPVARQLTNQQRGEMRVSIQELLLKLSTVST